MIRVILVCMGGISTSFVIKKMEAAFARRNIAVDINARSSTALVDYIRDADLVLVAPQVKYMEKEIDNLCTEYNIPWSSIESTMYGRMDGERLADLSLSLLGK